MQSPSTPTSRTPYRNIGTPPTTPLRLSSASPLGWHMADTSQPYPESPTTPVRLRLPTPRPPAFVLSQPKRYRFLRPLRSLRKGLTWLLLIVGFGSCLHFLLTQNSLKGGMGAGPMKWLTSSASVEEEEMCRFVSPVEAYHRDLRRLRGPTPHLQPANGTIPLPQPQHAHSHHLYSPTGHLLVSSSEDPPHPIPLLLSLGEKRWEELLSRQSRSLGEAVREYTRRYGRPPPKGFEIWWEFAMEHDLVLPDEYDRINLDLAPFFALPKDEMRRRIDMVELMKETFTLRIEEGVVIIQILDQGGLQWDGTWPRASEQANLIKRFARFLPDMKMTFSIFDQPQIYLSWGRRESLVELGLRNEYTTHLEETDDARVRLSRCCHPESNYRKNSSFHEGRSLIYDGLEAGDLCQNPYIVPLHGLTIEPHDRSSHPRPHSQLLPLFSLAKTSINSDILITPLDQFHNGPGDDPKWEAKRSSKLAWRGSPTGISMMNRDLPWRQAHRVRLHHFANNQSASPSSFIAPNLGLVDDDDNSKERGASTISEDQQAHWRALPPKLSNSVLKLKAEEVTAAEMADFFFDMKLAGQPLQCSDVDGTCQDMLDEIDWAPQQSSAQLNTHKFLLDIDGNGWSGRFRRLMSTNSVVIKTSIFTEWFQPHLIPWFMYIPAKLDFSDLADILAFFRGSPKHPDLAFDETAKALAINGKCFVQRMFRMEDIQAYMMRLFLEYARLQAPEGIDMARSAEFCGVPLLIAEQDFYYHDTMTEDDHSRGGADDDLEDMTYAIDLPDPEQHDVTTENPKMDKGEKNAGREIPDSEMRKKFFLAWGAYDEPADRIQEHLQLRG